jgi:hypothetical protein
MPTRPPKEHPQTDLSLPDFRQRNSKIAKQTLAPRPRNATSKKATTSIVYPKAKTGENLTQNGTKRRTAMPSSNAVDKPVSSSSDRVVINEAKRRYVLRPQIGYSANSINMMLTSSYGAVDESYNHYSPDEQVVSGILDGITSLCLGPTLYPHHYRPEFSTGGVGGSTGGRVARQRPSSPQQQQRKKKVVYPIASYPARLNCQKLVSERRAVFQQNLFRPVSSDEMSHYHTPVRAS